MRPEFKPWPSIYRLSNEIVTVTEKIDGTNGVIYVSDDGIVIAGSRNRWLTATDDNFGFASWVAEHADDCRKLGPGFHYGEWHGHGIQRGYGLRDRRFALFAHWRSDAPTPFVTVPVIYRGPWDEVDLDRVINRLNAYGSLLHHGFMNPEGIVFSFSSTSCVKFKKLCKNDKLHKFQVKNK